MKPTFNMCGDFEIIHCGRPTVEELEAVRQEALKTNNPLDAMVFVWLDVARRFVGEQQQACGGLLDSSLLLVAKGKSRFFPIEGLRVKKMARNQCHWNDPDATGFALAGGIWRRHSWKMDGARIVETTTATNEQYYGILFDDTTRAEFAAARGPCP